MKKICAIILTLVSLPAFAQENTMFCPDKIICDEAGNITSCHGTGNALKYFISMTTNAVIEKATYVFYLSQTSYHSLTMTSTICSYTYTNPQSVTKIITLNSVAGLMAYVDASTKWQITDSFAQCTQGTSLECPFSPWSPTKKINIKERG